MYYPSLKLMVFKKKIAARTLYLFGNILVTQVEMMFAKVYGAQFIMYINVYNGDRYISSMKRIQQRWRILKGLTAWAVPFSNFYIIINKDRKFMEPYHRHDNQIKSCSNKGVTVRRTTINIYKQVYNILLELGYEREGEQKVLETISQRSQRLRQEHQLQAER